MKLPKQVLEVASFLKETNDPRFQTMYALITPKEIKEDWDNEKDYPDDIDYEDMWDSLKKQEENIRGELPTSDWVYDFLNDVIAAQRLPKYIYADIEKRIALITELDALTRNLGKIYSENGSFFDARMKQYLRREGYAAQENKTLFGTLNVDAISGDEMAQALSLYTESLIKDIGLAQPLTKDSKGVEERMFAVALVKRNECLYGTKLNKVVATAMWALFGTRHKEGGIRNIVRRSQEF